MLAYWLQVDINSAAHMGETLSARNRSESNVSLCRLLRRNSRYRAVLYSSTVLITENTSDSLDGDVLPPGEV